MSKHITRYAVAAVLFAGCYQDDASVTGALAVRPQITVRLTDAPFPYDSLHSVKIYVVRIEANTTDTSGGGQWTVITEPRKTFDLLALQQGATAILGQGEMPAGQYRAVRMTIDTSLSSITWNDAARFGAWLYGILVNRCRTTGARAAKRGRVFVRDEAALNGVAHASAAEQTEGEDVVRWALARLTTEYREAFLLKHVEDLEYEEMARLTGASVSALKMRVKRAREQLQAILREAEHV